MTVVSVARDQRPFSHGISFAHRAGMTPHRYPGSRIIESRHDEGEYLYVCLGRDAHDAHVIAGGASAVVIAYPTAYLVGRDLAWVAPMPPRTPPPGTADSAFRCWAKSIPAHPDIRISRAPATVLIDDGLMPHDELLALVAAIRAARPKRLVVAAPWIDPALRARLAILSDAIYPRRTFTKPVFAYEALEPGQAAWDLGDVARRNWLEQREDRPPPEETGEFADLWAEDAARAGAYALDSRQGRAHAGLDELCDF